MMPGLTRTRLACDRCHSQKLRCPKQPGSSICTRCLKANTQCTYSPPGTISTCSVGSTANVADLMAMDDSMQDNGFFSWASTGDMDFNAFLTQEADAPEDGGTGPNGHSFPALSSPPTDEPADLGLLCTSRLAALLVDMGRLWERMPVKSTLHLAQSTSHEEHVRSLTDKIASKVALETIFALAQRLTDLYPDATSLALPPDAGPPQACDIPDCTHSLQLPSGLDGVEEHVSGRGKGGAAAGVDLPLASVLASCHGRLLDLVDCFFLLVTACLRVTTASPHRREPEFSGPEMRVGSFVPPKAAAVSMQVALLKHLMVGLSDRLASFGAAVSSRAAGLGASGGGMEVQILTLQHQLLMKRHASCLVHVGTIEDFLMRFDTKQL